MKDIELVIKIPKGQYEFIMEGMSIDKIMEYPAIINAICERIINGTPLPKGHGRLFDERDIVNGNYEVIGNRIYELESVIEADKEGE